MQDSVISYQSRLRRPNVWTLAVMVVAALMGLPMLVILGYLFVPAGDVLYHLAETVLDEYVLNSLILMAGVSFGVLTMGVTSAWLITQYEFPGRRLFSWALLLPLAIPAYIIAYTYTGMLGFEGPVQAQLREWTGWRYGDYWFPEIRSMGGAVAMLSLVLYPYVYMMARAAFLEQSHGVIEAARVLGEGPWGAFLRVALPLARPAIVTGLSLALMETLADYGTVQYFGVNTFTTGIFRTWFGLGDSAAAAQLAAMLLGFVFALIVLERWSRRRARFHHSDRKHTRPHRHRLSGWPRRLAVTACLLPLVFGFVLPAAQLLYWALTTATTGLDARFVGLTLNSLGLAAAAAAIAVVLALILGYGRRLRPGRAVTAGVRLAAMGYAVPGTVIAVGVLLPFAWLDNSIDAWMRERFDISTGLLLSGTLAALLFAYTVRFLSVSLQAVEAGLGKIRLSMDDAARSLGRRPLEVLREVHLPLMKSTVLTALLLVFVDVLKELPATLILRPFNFNTLAVRAYEMAADERLADAGAPALMIVAVGILPVILLSRAIGRDRPSHLNSEPPAT